jgi:hypothetical protein
MLKLLMVACVIITAESDAGIDKSTACEQACDVHYTKVYRDCNSVPECEAYVRRDHQACFRHCEQEQKDDQ